MNACNLHHWRKCIFMINVMTLAASCAGAATSSFDGDWSGKFECGKHFSDVSKDAFFYSVNISLINGKGRWRDPNQVLFLDIDIQDESIANIDGSERDTKNASYRLRGSASNGFIGAKGVKFDANGNSYRECSISLVSQDISNPNSKKTLSTEWKNSAEMWVWATEANTENSYLQFMERFPSSMFISQAEERLSLLKSGDVTDGKSATKLLLEAYPNSPTNPQRQSELGWKYVKGDKVERDYKHAMHLFLSADELGNPSGTHGLGYLYLYGPIEYRNEVKGVEKLQNAIANDYKYALVDLAKAALEGRGMVKNEKIGVKYLQEAIDRGNEQAFLTYGLALRDGVGVEKNESEAIYWLNKARESGNESAKKELLKIFGANAIEASISDSVSTTSTDSNRDVLFQDVVTTDQQNVKKSKPADVSIYANRKALVIGNDSYKYVSKLFTAREDAKSIAEGLRRVGYQVTLKVDLGMQGMKSAIRTFKSQIEGGDEVAIFYAGHGVQLSNTNFLLPVDISGESEEQIKDDAIPLQRLLDDISERKAKFTLAMVDACRDNPFKGANGRSIGGTRGLSPTSAATGQMIVFSAGTGQQALDRLGPSDKNKNGVFTRVFLKQLETQGISVDKLVRNVRTEVVGLAKSVGHEQVPAIYDQVVGEFYFRK